MKAFDAAGGNLLWSVNLPDQYTFTSPARPGERERKGRRRKEMFRPCYVLLLDYDVLLVRACARIRARRHPLQGARGESGAAQAVGPGGRGGRGRPRRTRRRHSNLRPGGGSAGGRGIPRDPLRQTRRRPERRPGRECHARGLCRRRTERHRVAQETPGRGSEQSGDHRLRRRQRDRAGSRQPRKARRRAVPHRGARPDRPRGDDAPTAACARARRNRTGRLQASQGRYCNCG